MTTITEAINNLYERALRLTEVTAEVAAAEQRRRDHESKFGRSYRGWSPHGPSDTLNGRHGGAIAHTREATRTLAGLLGANWTPCLVTSSNTTPDGNVVCPWALEDPDGQAWSVVVDGPDTGTLVQLEDATISESWRDR
jgi:hypothetical protein